jgi:predicted DNA-binding transcriptional regulator AlpA
MSIIPFQGHRHHLDRRALALIEEATLRSDDELIATPNLAQWLGVSIEWLEIGRSKGKGWGPPYVKLSPRHVRYQVGAVKKWLAERHYKCTGEYLNGGEKPKRRRPRLYQDDPPPKITPPWAERMPRDDEPPDAA